jgi:iron(III) transport system substrate-binding protein
LAACGSNAVNNGAEVQQTETAKTEEQVVNLYTDRHYDTDQELFDQFETETGIKVNVVTGKSDELIERLTREGSDTEEDLLITADVGRLYNAKETGLLQSATSETLETNIPENFRDADNEWYGLTVRGRVIVYFKDRVDPSELSTYDDLTTEKWNGKILVRSSENIYNLSLLASFIAINGEEAVKEWAAGIVNNMARKPEGNFEYPVNPEVEPSELLKSWGDFKAEDIDLSLLGEYNATAAKIFNEVGWK